MEFSPQTPIQWVPMAISPGVKRPRREVDHITPTSAEVKNAWIYTSTSPHVFGQLYVSKFCSFMKGKVVTAQLVGVWTRQSTTAYENHLSLNMRGINYSLAHASTHWTTESIFQSDPMHVSGWNTALHTIPLTGPEPSPCLSGQWRPTITMEVVNQKPNMNLPRDEFAARFGSEQREAPCSCGNFSGSFARRVV
jgi:hypothetical protein